MPIFSLSNLPTNAEDLDPAAEIDAAITLGDKAAWQREEGSFNSACASFTKAVAKLERLRAAKEPEWRTAQPELLQRLCSVITRFSAEAIAIEHSITPQGCPAVEEAEATSDDLGPAELSAATTLATPAPFSGEGHRLDSGRPTHAAEVEDNRTIRAERAEHRLRQKQEQKSSETDDLEAPPKAWAIAHIPKAIESARKHEWGKDRRGRGEFFGGDQVLLSEANAKQQGARAESSAFSGEGHRIGDGAGAGSGAAGATAAAKAAAEARVSAGVVRAEGAPRPAMPEPKILHKRKPISQLPAPASGSFDPFGTDGVKAPELPPLRFGLGDAVKCNMGKDGYQEC